MVELESYRKTGVFQKLADLKPPPVNANSAGASRLGISRAEVGVGLTRDTMNPWCGHRIPWLFLPSY